MVTSSVSLDVVFGALADPTRRSILERLGGGGCTVGELAEPFQVSRPAISKHLRVLEGAGLVRRERDGRVSRCELAAAPMASAMEWLSDYRVFWEGALGRLDQHLKTRAEADASGRTTSEEGS